MSVELRHQILKIIDGLPSCQAIQKNAVELIICGGQSLYRVKTTFRENPEFINAWFDIECALKVYTILWHKISRNWSFDY
jgi:hypothetical protein